MSALLAGMNQAAAAGLAALLNTLWYAGAVVVLTWAGLRFWPRLNAATRHWVWTAVLVFLLVLPFLPSLAARARVVFAVQARATHATVAPAAGSAPAEMARHSAPVMLTLSSAPGSNPWPLLLMAAWVIAAAWQLTRLSRGIASVRRLKARGDVAPMDRLPGHLRRRVRLLISEEVASPVAVGYRHPAIVVPPGLLERLEEGERQDVLLHELAHLARYDDWTAVATRAFGALLILHPLSAIVLGRIEREREMACDDFVVMRTGSARNYARSLARLHDLRWNAGTRLLAPGILGRNSSLPDRIESLLRRGRVFSARPSLSGLGVCALLLVVLLGAAGLIPGWIAIAQTKESAPAPKFEVASIKPDRSGGPNRRLMMAPGRFITTGVPLKMIIAFAYNLRSDDQLTAGPKWIDSETFDINAKEPDPFVEKLRKLPFGEGEAQIRLMVQSLLVDRFKLRVSDETKDLPIFALVVAKNGPKLKASTLPALGPIGANHPSKGGFRGMRMTRDGNLSGTGASMSFLADVLSRQPDVGRLVVDRTGLKGDYDFTLHWTPSMMRAGMYRGRGLALSRGPGGGAKASGSAQQPAGLPTSSQASSVSSDSSGPSIFTAVQQQLGLKLKPAKGPVEMLIIDHIEQPSPD